MKKLFACCVLMFLVACTSPVSKVGETDAKMTITSAQITALSAQMVQQANGFVTAAQSVTHKLEDGKEKQALEATLGRANTLLNDAGYTLTFDQKTEFEKLADNLMSDNVANYAKGLKQLAEKDKELGTLSQKLAEKEKKLKQLQEEYRTEVLALVADNVAKDRKISEQSEKLGFWNTIGRVAKWATCGFAITLLLPLLAPLLPTFAPFLLGIGKFIGWGLKSLLKIPGALVGASVVVKEEFDKIRQVAVDHIEAQEDIRNELKDNGVIAKEKHDKILKEYITEADGTAAVVDEIRRERLLLK